MDRGGRHSEVITASTTASTEAEHTEAARPMGQAALPGDRA